MEEPEPFYGVLVFLEVMGINLLIMQDEGTTRLNLLLYMSSLFILIDCNIVM
jgi:hypothetical protein